MSRAWIGLGLIALVGCGNAPAPDALPVSLTQPAHITAAGTPDEKSGLRFRVDGLLSGTRTDVEVGIEQIDLAVTTTAARASLDRLSLVIGDVDVSPDVIPPDGFPLRGLALGMPRADGEMGRRERDALSLTVEAPLVLTGAVALPSDGGVWPMGTQRSAPLELSVEIERDADGRARAEQSTRCPGLCWELPGVIAVRDLVIYAVLDADIAAN